jgi:hypothetical protein
VWSARRHPGREEEIYLPGRGSEAPAGGTRETDEAEEAAEEAADGSASDVHDGAERGDPT